MQLLDIAYLKNVGAGTITLVCMLPPLIFCIYVKWDDHRQAKAHAHDSHGHGTPPGGASGSADHH